MDDFHSTMGGLRDEFDLGVILTIQWVDLGVSLTYGGFLQ